MLAVLLGMLVGRSGSPSCARSELSPFQATRPLSSRALAFVSLRTAVLTYLFAFAIALAAILVWCGWLYSRGQVEEIHHGFENLPAAFRDWRHPFRSLSVAFFYLLGIWAIMGLTASISMTGRGRIQKWAGILLLLGLFSPLILSNLAVTPQRVLLQMFLWLFVVLSIGGTFWAFIRSHGGGHLTRRNIMAAFVAWLGLYALVFVNDYLYNLGLNDPIDFLAMLECARCPSRHSPWRRWP